METGVTSSGPADGFISLMDQNAVNPGPLDASVLYDQENHVSSAVWDGQVHFAATHFLYFYP